MIQDQLIPLKKRTKKEDLLLMDMDLIAFRELNDLDYEDED